MKHPHWISGAMLVAGTSIGGGMLALPILTSPAGFVPALLVFIACWIFMTCTGLLFVEVSLWMKKEANIVSMAEKTLGFSGKVISWILYLFLFYCLTLAYVVGGGNLTWQWSGGLFPEWLAPFIFVAIFSPMVFAGVNFVSKINLWMMAGLGISYLLFVIIGFPSIKWEFLKYRDWSLSMMAFPIAFTSFAYQGTIPTLVNHLNHDISKIRKAIFLGTSLPFIAYLIWEMLILGIVPLQGEGGLLEALLHGDNAVHPLRLFLDDSRVYVVGQAFAFFALVTSFFGVTLGMLDFLADGLRVSKGKQSRAFLCALVFLPPLFLAKLYPHLFLTALDLAGAYGCALLLGLLPILMVWRGRYSLGLKGKSCLPGGKTALFLLLCFLSFVLCYQILVPYPP